MYQRNAFSRNLYSEVSPGDHYAVTVCEYVVEIVHALLIFDFGDYLQMASPLVQDGLDFLEVIGASNERVCDEVDIGLDCPVYEFLVFFCQCRQVDVN